MTQYFYEDLTQEPCLDKIVDDVAASDMTDKNLGDIFSNANSSINLIINWNTDLSAEDKTILDGVVLDSLGRKLNNKSRETILGEIFDNAEPTVQQPRLVGALNIMATMIAALDNMNYPLARGMALQALGGGLILQEDYDLVISKIPDSKYI